MRVIVKARLLEFADEHPQARGALNAWYAIVRRASWRTFSDVRRTFARTDRVTLDRGNVITIFDVGGNRFRVLTYIKFNTRCIYIKSVLTHAEYDDETWKESLDHAP